MELGLFCNIQVIIEHFTSNIFMDFSSIIKTLKLHIDYSSQSNGLEACTKVFGALIVSCVFELQVLRMMIIVL
jgi:hypothetical protein